MNVSPVGPDDPGWSKPDCRLVPPETPLETPAIAASALLGSPPPQGKAPYGATRDDTSEFMTGDVWVTVVLLESDGTHDPNKENWTSTEINQVKTEIQEGLTWWEQTLASAPAVSPLHDLTFHADFTYADAPVATGYEPITRSTSDEGLWINDFLNQVGYNSPSSHFTDVRKWDHDQRLAHNAHWAYTVFVVDSSKDPDGTFSDGYFAYAYLGGPLAVMTYDNDGWGISRMGQVFAHETAHVFYAWDEYPGSNSYTERSGYYNTQNLNAYDGNPNPSSRVASLMAEASLQNTAYANHTSSPTSLQMLGWKDLDADGIFDVLDVPLQLTGSGQYNVAAGQYEFSGSSSVEPLANLNPNSSRHAITTNTVDRIQHRLDGGAWTAGNAYGDYVVSVAQSVPIPPGQHSLEFRTIFEETGLTSNVWAESSPAPVDLTLAPSSVAEHQPAGTVVGSLITTSFLPGATYSYAMVSGAGSDDNTSFTIDGSQLKTAAVFDYATKSSYSVRVRTTGPGGQSYEEALTVPVDNLLPTVVGYSLADDTGIASGDQITSDTTPTLTFVFSEPVYGTDAGVTVTGPGGGTIAPDVISGWGTSTLVVAFTATTLAANGQYTVGLSGTAIVDASGTGLNGGVDEIRHFTIDTAAPTADVADVAPDPRTAGVDQIAIPFSEPVYGLDLADLTLTRDGGGNLLTGVQSLTTSDNIVWTLGNLSGITAPPGIYVLTLTAPGSGIADAAGNALAAGAGDTWLVNPSSFSGTAAADTYEFIAAGGVGGLPTRHQLRVTLFGSPMVTYLYDAAGPVTLNIDAKEGSDKLTITGGPGTDTTVINRYFVQHTGPGATSAPGYYYVYGNNVETIIDNAGAGTAQRSTFHDSPDNGDVFTASALYRTGSMKSATGSLNVYNNSSTGYDQIYGIGGNGGINDRADLYDSNGNDYYVSRAGALVNPISYIQRSSGGTGTAALVTAVSGFEYVYGMATAGGVDEAVLFGSNGDDSMRFEPGYTSGTLIVPRVYMTRPGGYFIYAQNFKKVTGYPEDGNDQVAFFDTAQSDIFTASPTQAQLDGPPGSNILNIAVRFDTVRAYSQVGGYDKAYLTGSTGDDTFLGYGKPRTVYPGMGRLTGTGYFLEVYQFEEVYADLNGGNDTANLYDGSANDYFWAKLGAAVLTDGTVSDATGDLVTPSTYYYKLYGFDSAASDRVNLWGASGGTNTKRVITPLDYLLATSGTWTEAP